jgi:putative flippase GtrA
MQKLFRQFFKFGLVGLTNTAVNFTVYYLLVYFGAHYLVATTIAFVVSVLNAFLWSKKFVFTESTKSPRQQLVRLYFSYGMTFLLNLFMMYVMVDMLGVSQLVAPLLNLFVTVPLNFLLNKFWVFR